MSEATLTIPVDLWKFSQNALSGTKSWAKRGRIVKSGREAGYVAWLAAGRPPIGHRARIDVTVRRGRTFDVANVYGACKPLIDGVFGDGLCISDSQVVIGGVTFETGDDWKGREGVEMRFEWSDEVKLTGKINE